MKFCYLRNIAFGLLTLFAISCDKNCNVECFTPPAPLEFMITDKITASDLVYTGVYRADTIEIFYFENSLKKYVDVTVFSDTVEQISIIRSNEIGFISAGGIRDFYLYLDWQDTDTLHLDVVTVNEDCCTYHNYNYFGINGDEIEYDNDDDIYNYRKLTYN